MGGEEYGDHTEAHQNEGGISFCLDSQITSIISLHVHVADAESETRDSGNLRIELAENFGNPICFFRVGIFWIRLLKCDFLLLTFIHHGRIEVTSWLENASMRAKTCGQGPLRFIHHLNFILIILFNLI